MKKLRTPYIVRSQCDFCPHKNLARWQNTSPEMLSMAAEFEKKIGKGDFFLTDSRIPLLDAIKLKESRQSLPLFDTCDSGYCFT